MCSMQPKTVQSIYIVQLIYKRFFKKIIPYRILDLLVLVLVVYSSQ